MTVSEPRASVEPARATAPRAGARPRTGASWRFYACVLILLASAAGIQAVARLMQHHLVKLPVKLKVPIALMDKRKLSPEYELHVAPSPALSDELLQSLGTDEYLSWRLVDLARDRSDPASVANLFITFYTGRPDLVPHVPDECYAAGGYDQSAPARAVKVAVPGTGAPNDALTVRVLTFQPPQKSLKPGALAGDQTPNTVMYFFHVNGRYATTRNEVRMAQSNPRDRYAYYIKIEVSFTTYNFSRRATADEAVRALPALLKKIMPILLADHLPDWKTLNSEPAQAER